MFIAALFIIDKKWTGPKCASTDECTNKMWYIHSMEELNGKSIHGKNEVQHSTTWINLENSIISERRQTQEATYCMILIT